MAAHLIAENISYSYSQKHSLFRAVNLEIKPGEVVGLYGESGIGKTTLAKILAGYLTPDSGEVRIGETPIPNRGLNPVQMIWQHPEKAVNPRWQMQKILAEGGELPKGLQQQLGLQQDWMYRFPGELSGGELQRFCLARALGPATRFLIADEMTTMLDALTQAQIWKAVLQLAEHRNLGVLVISHQQELLKKVSHRLVDFASWRSSNS